MNMSQSEKEKDPKDPVGYSQLNTYCSTIRMVYDRQVALAVEYEGPVFCPWEAINTLLGPIKHLAIVLWGEMIGYECPAHNK
jgi:hypothetical protein